jgi:hypothetical protein
MSTTPAVRVDDVEIKFTLAAWSLPAALASFGPAEGVAKKRDVFLFDTAPWELLAAP